MKTHAIKIGIVLLLIFGVFFARNMTTIQFYLWAALSSVSMLVSSIWF